MKKVLSLVIGVAVLSIYSCGPSAEEMEQARQDSIRMADSVAMAEQARMDSIAAAEAMAEQAAMDTTATDTTTAQ